MARAYPWRDPGADVPLAPDVDRVASYDRLGADALARADELLARVPAVSLHDHPVRLPDPLTPESWATWRAQGRETLGYSGLARSGLAAVLASALSGLDLPALTRWAGLLRADLAHRADAVAGLTVLDVPPGAAEANGRPLAVFLALEDLGSIDTDLSGIEVLYGAGVRSAGLTYNRGNPLGGGLESDPDDGLTPVGRRAVELMNELGMVVDVAHVGDRTALDACRVSDRPVLVSHAGARAVWPTPRMKPDDVVRAVADTGGVIGVEAAPHSTVSYPHPRHDLDAIMDHVTHLVELVGVEHVGFGPDTFFGDHVGFYTALGHRPAWTAPPHEPVEWVAGMENPGEAVRNATAWLVEHGWADDDIAKLVGGNAMRVLRATVGADTPR
jgi:membrane dipeptidase